MDLLLEAVAVAVAGLKPDAAAAAVRAALDAGVPAREIVTDGLSEGMRRVGEKFACKEYFIPEVLVSSRAMYAGLEIARPHMAADPAPSSGTIVLGVVKGDRHDIGKNVVKIMLESSGFEVLDLGRDVPRERFVEALRESKAAMLGLSTLMTTTMPELAAVVEAVRGDDALKSVAVLVGGAPTSLRFANDVGADAHGADAHAAVQLAKEYAAK